MVGLRHEEGDAAQRVVGMLYSTRNTGRVPVFFLPFRNYDRRR